MENKRVIAYGYFSDLGINTRENAMKHFEDYIKLNENWKLEKVYLYTGSKIRNDNMIKQIEESIEKKEVDIVILLKLKHLGKERDFYNFVDKALANNVNVISIRDNFNTLDNSCRIQYQIIREMLNEEKKLRRNRNNRALDR